MQHTLQDAISRNNRYATKRSHICFTRLKTYREGLVETLARILGLRDPDLQVHALRVADFATKLAGRLGCSEQQVDLIRRGSLLHDIGKLGVSQDLLSKPTRLTLRQYETIQTHPVLGAALLQEYPEYRALVPIVLHHHEFFNGHGYPDRIAGDEIEFEARIIAVADAVDVMESNRPYRKAFAIRQIIDELENCAGTQFDPIVVEAAISLLLDRKHENSHYSSSLLAPIMIVEHSNFMECGDERQNQARS
jgi:putative nucleotidyltransferase with HDIG domain